MSFPPYASYKNTGVEWLGAVPSHWTVQPLKVAAHVEMGQSPPSDLCAPDGPGIPFLQGCAEFGDVSPSPKNYCEQPPKMAVAGDTLLSVRAPVGAMNTADQAYGIGRGLCALRSNINQQFLRYSLETGRAELGAVATGSTYAAVSVADVGRLQVPTPPANEQRAIADFLDRETAKIDALVEAQRRLIALLKEKRRALISHAVTKGLDFSASLKPSGIKWLGDVPAHWEVTPIRYLCGRIEQGWSPQCENYPVADASQQGVLKVGCVNDGRFRSSENKVLPDHLDARGDFAVRRGDLLISRANTRELVGSAAFIDADHPNLMISDKLYRIRFPRIEMSQFMAFVLGADGVRAEIELAATGASSSMLNIAQDTILSLVVPVPPPAEMPRLCSTLDQRLVRLEKEVTTSAQAIALLTERRAALISAAVTGKIDVRGLVAQPQPAEAA